MRGFNQCSSGCGNTPHMPYPLSNWGLSYPQILGVRTLFDPKPLYINFRWIPLAATSDADAPLHFES